MMRGAGRLLAPAALLPLPACTGSPAQNILGAYFPAWLLCAAAGVVAAAIARQLCVLAGLERHLLAPPLVYASLALAATLLLWLFLFGQG